MEVRKVWIPSVTEGWTCASIVKEDRDRITVKTDTDKQEVVKLKDTLLVREFIPVDDMVELEELHEANLLSNLQQRYLKDQVYTHIGPMIIFVNPYKKLPIYDEEIISKYQTRNELTPHLFSISNKAFQNLLLFGQSQSIVISGESGAGKTEATKIVLKYLTSVAHNASTSTINLASRILATNPVLEAFGNAKTILNNNSSRFGKFIKICFDDTGGIIGARIDNYLLEQTRLIRQAPTERNYHIFYQMISGSSLEEKKKYNLLSATSDYDYLKSENKIDGIDDVQDWETLKSAMNTLGISQQDEYFILLSAILHLGNIQFKSVERDGMSQAVLVDPQKLEVIEELLGLQAYDKEVKDVLTTKTVRAGSVKTTTPLSPELAEANRDALAKVIYSRLFDHLVSQLNQNLFLGERYPENSKYIGVLDLYGFEKFEVNSLEQFCINYANEKLHSQFIEHMFNAEQQEYKSEDVKWSNIESPYNKATMLLFESPNGLFAMLDEECRMPQGSDKTFLDKIKMKLRTNPSFQFNIKTPEVFIINHYAEPVSYHVDSFVNKSRDRFNLDLAILLNKSTLPLLKSLFKEGEGPHEEENVRRTNLPRLSVSKTITTVTRKFQQSLAELFTTLASTQRHYVKCIKPNNTSTPRKFSGDKVLSQLRSNGILETVKLRKAGYATRIPFEQFFQRYRVMPGLKSAVQSDISEFLHQTLNNDNEWAVGRTKVFLKIKGAEELETKRQDQGPSKSIVKIQAYIQRFIAMEILEQFRIDQLKHVAATNIQCHVRAYHARIQYNLLLEELPKLKDISACVLQRYIRCYIAHVEYINAKEAKVIHNQKDISACILQRYIRCYIAHVEYLNAKEAIELRLKHDETLLVEAIIAIQRFIRQYTAHQLLLYYREELFQMKQKLLQMQAGTRLVETPPQTLPQPQISVSTVENQIVEDDTDLFSTTYESDFSQPHPTYLKSDQRQVRKQTSRMTPQPISTRLLSSQPLSNPVQSHRSRSITPRDSSSDTLDLSYDPEEEIGNTLYRICMQDQSLCRLKPEIIEGYADTLRSNMVLTLRNVAELDSEGWAVLGQQRFPARLRQLLVNETKPIKINNERGIILSNASVLANQGFGTMFTGLLSTLGFTSAYNEREHTLVQPNQQLNPTPTEERDLDLLFQVARMIHVRGDYYMRGLPSTEFIIEMAALDCHVTCGSYDDFVHSIDNTISDHELQFFPFNESNHTLELKSFERYKQFKTVTPEIAKLCYIRNFASLKTNDGITRFYVTSVDIDIEMEEEEEEEWIFGISNEKLYRKYTLPDKTERTLAEWDFTKVTRWRYDDNSQVFTIEIFEDNPLQFICNTIDATMMSALLFHYFEILMTKNYGGKQETHLKTIVEIEVRLYGQKDTNHFAVRVTQTIDEICTLIAKHFGFETDGRYGLRVEWNKDENTFLNPMKALNQQDVDFDSVFLFCTRVFSPTPLMSRQSNYISFLFAESRDAIVNGKWVTDRDQASKLAALHIQYLHGDYNSNVHTSNFYFGKLRQIISEEYRYPPMIPKIIQEHQRLTGISPSDAAYRYLEVVRVYLLSYGDTFFRVNVEYKSEERESIIHSDLLRINYLGICHLEADTMQTLNEWPLSALKSFSVDTNGETLTLIFTDDYFVCNCPDALAIEKLITDHLCLEVARRTPKQEDGNKTKNTRNCLVM